MVKEYIGSAVKINADTGMDLLRTTDNYRAKTVYCPLIEDESWTEATEIPESLTDEEKLILGLLGV